MVSLPTNSRRFYETRYNIFALFYFQFKTMQKFNFDKDEVSPFSEVPSADFIDMLLQGGERADEAAYYLLHHRVNLQLRRRFEVYHSRLTDDFEDVVEDFFLYMREGNDGGDDGDRTPYQSLRSIRNREVLEAWLVSTFRNYLAVRADAEEQLLHKGLSAESVASPDIFNAADDIDLSDVSDTPNIADVTNSIASCEIPDTLQTDEWILSVAASLIAYAHQTFNPHYRFVLFRSLLSMLNRKQSIPNEAVAQALGMTCLSYRVTTHRAKCSLARLRDRLLRGESLPLDDTHLQMAQHINDDFSNLYPTLSVYYDQIIDTLPCAAAIRQLRQQYRETTGHTLHEPTASYFARLTVKGFWCKLNRWLIV